MPGARRTQAQRRAETSQALIDATIETIVEKGYAHVTVKEVCRRAGVSHGGLFGRFPTLFDLIAAAAEEVGRRQRESFVAKMTELPDRSDVIAVLALWRDTARDPVNTVWLELTVAARTDAALKQRLEVVRLEYAAALVSGGVKMPAARGLSAEQVLALGSIVLFCFDGDALNTRAFPQPELDTVRLEVLSTMVGQYLETHRGEE
ncbi:TetR/AcrR family transcriptional regulator [Nocardia sp. SSK8]|uniref:TetR/AcrR family transcriptional regulator n=1 Tax=Nocardia sp. SSK8 TaxID=3120154 RepID=UPI00300BA6AF